MNDWLSNNWENIAIPVIVFLAFCIVGLWLRRFFDRILKSWEARTKWDSKHTVRGLLQLPVFLWFVLLGIVTGIELSPLSSGVKNATVKTAGSLFIFTLGWGIAVFLGRLLRLYLSRVKVSRTSIIAAVNVVRIVVFLMMILIVLQIWGVPSTPILLIVAVVVFAIGLALRNSAPNFLAGIQLGAEQHNKAGDYIKLETGEEGYITGISWNAIRIRTLDDKIISLPNRLLLQHKVINYGQPLRKAIEPFHFYNRAQLTELTCWKAKDLGEFLEIIKQAPEAVIHFHTHHFLEEHHYLVPEPTNDFAVWVTDALGDEALGERIASVNPFEFASITALRGRFVGIIEEYTARSTGSREAMAGREFHFMKSLTAVLPTPYLAHDLREFIETLRKISLGSLYYHVFESRMRLGNGLNDFSMWMRDSMGESELSDAIAHFDPFNYTLEGLRLALIELIEKRIK